MVNAWSLAASILDGTFDKDYPIMTDIKINTGVGNSVTYSVPLGDNNLDEDITIRTESDPVEHSTSWYDYNRNDPDAKNPFTDAFDYAMGEAVVSGASVDDYYPPSFSTLSDNDDQIAHHVGSNYDELSLNIQANSPYNDGYTQDFYKEELKKTMTDSRNKYHENEILKDVEEYVSRTYNGHYTGTKHEYRNVQTIDLMASRDLASDFCQANILKYGSRYGSKD